MVIQEIPDEQNKRIEKMEDQMREVVKVMTEAYEIFNKRTHELEAQALLFAHYPELGKFVREAFPLDQESEKNLEKARLEYLETLKKLKAIKDKQ